MLRQEKPGEGATDRVGADVGFLVGWVEGTEDDGAVEGPPSDGAVDGPGATQVADTPGCSTHSVPNQFVVFHGETLSRSPFTSLPCHLPPPEPKFWFMYQ